MKKFAVILCLCATPVAAQNNMPAISDEGFEYVVGGCAAVAAATGLTGGILLPLWAICTIVGGQAWINAGAPLPLVE